MQGLKGQVRSEVNMYIQHVADCTGVEYQVMIERE